MNRCGMKTAPGWLALWALCLIGVGCSHSIPREDSLGMPDSGTASVKHELDIYVLIGQSNMAGRGIVEDQDVLEVPRVLTWTQDNAWAPAVDPLHFDKKIAGVGPGRTFGLIMAHDLSNTM